jgi:hypothetical protein
MGGANETRGVIFLRKIYGSLIYTREATNMAQIFILVCRIKNMSRCVVVPVGKILIEQLNRLSDGADKLEHMGFHTAPDIVEVFISDFGNYRVFLKAHSKRMRTMNIVERMNVEINRRTNVSVAFSSCGSSMRRVGSILMDIIKIGLWANNISIWRNFSIDMDQVQSLGSAHLPNFRSIACIF